MGFDEVIQMAQEAKATEGVQAAAASPGAADYMSTHKGMRPRDVVDQTRRPTGGIEAMVEMARSKALSHAELAPRSSGYVRMAGTEYENPALRSVAQRTGSIPQVSPAGLTPGRIAPQAMDYRMGTSDAAQKLAKRFL